MILVYIIFALITISFQNLINKQTNDQLDLNSNNSPSQSINDILDSIDSSIDFDDKNNDDEDKGSFTVDPFVKNKETTVNKTSDIPMASFNSDIKKSINVNCQFNNFHFEMMIDFDKINQNLDSKLKINEKDKIKRKCQTKENSFVIILSDGWTLSLNFTLMDQSNQDLRNIKQFKLNQVKFSVDNETTLFESENLASILKGHQSMIQCYNAKEVKAVSSIILNLENCKVEAYVSCMKKITHSISSKIFYQDHCFKILIFFKIF
jgi:hypothetical protein